MQMGVSSMITHTTNRVKDGASQLIIVQQSIIKWL